MTDHQLKVEFYKTKQATRVKVVLGFASIAGVIIIAMLFRFEFGLMLLIASPIGGYYGYKRIKHNSKLADLSLRQVTAETRILEEKHRQETILTKQLSLSSLLHETKTGVFVAGGLDNWSYVPQTAPERKNLGITSEQPLLEASTEHPSVLDVMKSWTMPLVCNGPQQSGKTFSTMAIVHSLNLPTIFVSLRNEPQYHFEGITLYSEERRKGAILAGFEASLEAMADYEPGVIVMDDFINLGLMLGDDKLLEMLIATIATQAVSHKKRIFFTMQSSTKNDFGLKRLGAGLKQNFALLEVPAPLKDKNLNVVSHSKIGSLYEPGNWDTGQEVWLPSALGFEPGAQLSEDDTIKKMIAEGKSGNQICNILGGNRQERMRQIKTIKAGL